MCYLVCSNAIFPIYGTLSKATYFSFSNQWNHAYKSLLRTHSKLINNQLDNMMKKNTYQQKNHSGIGTTEVQHLDIAHLTRITSGQAQWGDLQKRVTGVKDTNCRHSQSGPLGSVEEKKSCIGLTLQYMYWLKSQNIKLI